MRGVTQFLIISLGVPFILLSVLEIGARTIDLPSKFKTKKNLKLEMPTWMLQDANALAREKDLIAEPDSLEWLSLFEPGSGYRVRMIPNTERRVKNTFSLIPEDKNTRYLVKSNSIGFRSGEIQKQKAPGTYRILVFGDSSSFGWGADQNESFSALLPQEIQKLNSSTVKIELGNFAIPGDSSAYGRLIFDTFASKYNPDLVILGFGANDAKAVPVSHTSQVERFKSQEKLQKIAQILDMSALVRSLKELLSSLSEKPTPVNAVRVEAVSRPDYIRNLDSMSKEAQKNSSADVLILNLCTPAHYSKAAKGVAKNDKLLYFNGQKFLKRSLTDIVKGRLEPEMVNAMRAKYGRALKQKKLFYITSDGCHPNALGHKLLAKELAKKLMPIMKAKIEGKRI